MYLLFPDDEALRFCIANGIAPAPVVAAPCKAAVLENGSHVVYTSQRVGKAVAKQLDGFGVKTSRFSPTRRELTPFDSWLQLFEIRAQPQGWIDDPRLVGENAEVLLLFRTTADLIRASGEILRLGNDRQALRSVAYQGSELALLRVKQPPYYAMLRLAEDAQVAVLAQASPNVWIESGVEHPFVDRVRPMADQLLLLTSAYGWVTLENQPFSDLYEQTEFQLPAAVAELAPAVDLPRLKTRLSLRRDSGSAPPELWVLRGEAFQRLETLVEECDDGVVAKLMFAVANGASGERVAVLRSRTQGAGEIVLDAECYGRYLRIPNLFVPIGQRLQPPLRRDAAMKTLASDPSRIVWLVKVEDGGFQPESIADEAFRPLDAWVDYVVDRDAAELMAWVDSHQFEFDSFACVDDAPLTPGGDSPQVRVTPGKIKHSAQEKSPQGSSETPDEKQEVSTPLKPVKRTEQKPSLLRKELKQREREFTASDEPMDGDSRPAQWLQMAQLHEQLGDATQASLCWSNALWRGQHDTPQGRGLWRRMSGEQDSLAETLQGKITPNLATRLLTLLATANEQTRGEIAANGAAVAKRLQRVEPQSSVRLVWLAWLEVARSCGGDVLALTRARDRLLARMYEHGLRADVDLPLFLRNAEVDQERFTLVREYLKAFPTRVKEWIARQGTIGGSKCTAYYGNLYVAFGLARLGERNVESLIKSGKDNKDPVSDWFARVIRFRIDQVLKGEDCAGPLTAKLTKRLSAAAFKAQPAKNGVTYRYLVDRLRSESLILEPQEKVDPYRHISQLIATDWQRECEEMFQSRDPVRIKALMKSVLESTRKIRQRGPYAQAVAACLEMGPRIDEKSADKLLSLAKKAIPDLERKSEVAKIIKHGLYLAGHFELDSQIRSLIGLFRKHLLVPKDVQSRKALDETLFECFDGLRRLGLRDEIQRLLDQVVEAAEGMKKPKRGEVGSAAARRETRLKLMLHAASGRFYFGQTADAEELLDVVREALLGGEFTQDKSSRQQVASMSLRYVQALRHAPINTILNRIDDLLLNLRGVIDNLTTRVLYSRSQLNFIEACVMVLVSEDVSLSLGGRKWLDEDEYIVRRRIHADVREAMSAGQTIENSR